METVFQIMGMLAGALAFASPANAEFQKYLQYRKSVRMAERAHKVLDRILDGKADAIEVVRNEVSYVFRRGGWHGSGGPSFHVAVAVDGFSTVDHIGNLLRVEAGMVYVATIDRLPSSPQLETLAFREEVYMISSVKRVCGIRMNPTKDYPRLIEYLRDQAALDHTLRTM